MRQCNRCFQLKPLQDFYKDPRKSEGHKSICKACTLYRAKTTSYRKRKGPNAPIPASTSDVRAMAYYQRLMKRFSGTELEVPIKPRNSPLAIPMGCVMKRGTGMNLLLIATLRGLREYQLEMVGPEQFMEIIKELGYELIVPERMPHGET